MKRDMDIHVQISRLSWSAALQGLHFMGVIMQIITGARSLTDSVMARQKLGSLDQEQRDRDRDRFREYTQKDVQKALARAEVAHA